MRRLACHVFTLCSVVSLALLASCVVLWLRGLNRLEAASWERTAWRADTTCVESHIGAGSVHGTLQLDWGRRTYDFSRPGTHIEIDVSDETFPLLVRQTRDEFRADHPPRSGWKFVSRLDASGRLFPPGPSFGFDARETRETGRVEAATRIT